MKKTISALAGFLCLAVFLFGVVGWLTAKTVSLSYPTFTGNPPIEQKQEVSVVGLYQVGRETATSVISKNGMQLGMVTTVSSYCCIAVLEDHSLCIVKIAPIPSADEMEKQLKGYENWEITADELENLSGLNTENPLRLCGKTANVPADVTETIGLSYGTVMLDATAGVPTTATEALVPLLPWWLLPVSAIALLIFLRMFAAEQIKSNIASGKFSWKKNARPNMDAKIVGRSTVLGWLGLDNDQSTLVTFSDGFRMAVSGRNAEKTEKLHIIHAHEVALRLGLPTDDFVDPFAPPKAVPVSRTGMGNAWNCSCGRTNPGYATSCVCGKSKRDHM